jgi:PAS domain S-box-containing protein
VLSVTGNASEADSLRAALQSSPGDTGTAGLLHQLYQLTDSIAYPKRALELCRKLGYKRGECQAWLDLGRSYYFSGSQTLALDHLAKAVVLGEELGEKKILCNAYRYLGYIYRANDPFVAEDYYKKSLSLAEEMNDELSASYLYSAMGNIYEGIFEGPSSNNQRALDYYLKSLSIRQRLGSYEEIASSLNETSRIYDIMKEYRKAMDLRKKGLEMAEKAGSTQNIIYLCNVLGNNYSLHLHDPKKGLEYQLRAHDLAGQHLTSDFDVRFDIAKSIASSYTSLGDLANAGKFYQEALQINDSVRARRNNDQYNLSSRKHELEKEVDHQKELLHDSDELKNQAETGRQVIFRNALIIGLGLLFCLVLVGFRSYRQKQHSNRELALKNEKIERAYRSVVESENRFKQITETINDVFYLYNIIEKRYEYISPNCVIMFGLVAEQFYMGNSGQAEVFADDKPLVKAATQKLYSGIPYDIEYRMIIKGQLKWIAEKSSPIYDPDGKLVRNSGICRDITIRKIAEERADAAYRTLEVSESKFKQITETIDDVFYLYNIAEKRYEYISPNCIGMFGLHPDYFYNGGSAKAVVYEPDLEHVRAANVLVDSGTAYDIEYRLFVEGRIKWVGEKSSPIYDAQGRLVRNSGIIRDISQRKANEEALQDKNRDIMESILVARTIQNAILVPQEKMKERLQDFFILSRPKDIVSGDFYFYKETRNGIFIAAADCTGHGVPGGFMSMIGHAYLNEIVKTDENIAPSEVLDRLREMIIKALNQDGTAITNQDGMDIAILYLEKDGRSIQFAGAFNPLYIIRGDELEELSGNSFPIGVQIIGTPAPFTNHRLTLEKGDALYVFSDGYADQFGGPKGRKFMKRQMMELLLSVQEKDMEEQGKILEVAFNEWKGQLEQVDDVLVIGIRV